MFVIRLLCNCHIDTDLNNWNNTDNLSNPQPSLWSQKLLTLSALNSQKFGNISWCHQRVLEYWQPGFALTQKSAFFTQILRAGCKNDKLHAFWGRKFHKSMKIQTAHLADTTCQYGPAVNNKRSFTETQQTKIAPLPCNRHIIPYQILS